MNKNTLLLGLTVILSGCVTMKQVDERIAPWRTATVQQLIDAWGVPTKEQKVASRHYLIWNNYEVDSGVDVGISVGGTIGRNAAINLSTLFGGSAEEDVCSRVVEIDAEENILGIQWNGAPSTCFDVTPVRQVPKSN